MEEQEKIVCATSGVDTCSIQVTTDQYRYLESGTPTQCRRRNEQLFQKNKTLPTTFEEMQVSAHITLAAR